MDIYYHKYNKYKIKYLEMKKIEEENQVGGKLQKNHIETTLDDKIKQILDFISKSSKEKISDELSSIITYNVFCSIILGEGFSGKTYIPNINKTIPYMVGKKQIDLPIIVKESKNIDNPQRYFGTDIYDSKLYITGYADMTTELLILLYVKKLYNKTVHLPLVLGYGTCSSSNYSLVNRIILYKYGLDQPVQIDLRGKIFNEDKMWHKPRKEPTEIFTSSLSTLRELLTFIHYSKKSDGSVELPNGIKCDNIAELFDYICISYLATHELLVKNGIYPSDMHNSNIFIHWLDVNSYYDKTNIKNTKEIFYKVGKKLYKIKTFGFVIILGDTGTFILDVKKDVIIAGQIYDIKNNYKLISRRMTSNHTAFDFIYNNYNFLTNNEFSQTIAYKILNLEPYCSYPLVSWHLLGWNNTYLDKLKTSDELIEFYYEKYGVKKYTKTKTNILISV